jgi:hypothetical protein
LIIAFRKSNFSQEDVCDEYGIPVRNSEVPKKNVFDILFPAQKVEKIKNKF